MEGGGAAPSGWQLGGGHGAAAAGLWGQRSREAMAGQLLLLLLLPLLLQLLLLHLLQLLSGLHLGQLLILLTHLLGEKRTRTEEDKNHKDRVTRVSVFNGVCRWS